MTCSSTYHRALLHIYLHSFVLVEHRNSYSSMVLFAILACSTVLLFKLATSLLGVDVVVIGILEYLKINLTTLQWLLCRRSHARSHAFVIRFIVAVTDCFLICKAFVVKAFSTPPNHFESALPETTNIADVPSATPTLVTCRCNSAFNTHKDLVLGNGQHRTSFAARSNVLPVTCVTVAPTVFPMRRDLSIDPFPTKMFAACPCWFNIGSSVSSIGGCWLSDTTPGCNSTEDVVNKPWNLFRPCRNWST